TGFIVFNERTYPNFVRLMNELGVASKPSTMCVSVRDERTGFEWGSRGLGAMLAQPTNLLRPRFLGMFREIVRFNRESPALLEARADETLGAYLRRKGYSPELRDHYLVPLGASIWSAPPGRFEEIPARFFGRFFDNHGMNTVWDQPRWRVIVGGSKSYVGPLV